MLYFFDAYINGVSFAHLDPAIILQDINELPPEEEVQQTMRSLHAGTRITSRVRRSLSLRLVYNVREYDIAARARVLDKIAAWVGSGGWLTINSRPGQRLYVKPDEMPSMGSSLKWTGEMTMTLTAYERPYWEQVWPETVTVTSSGTITPLGTVPEAYVECDVTNMGESPLTELVLACGDTMIKLQNLSVPVGEHVVISYTDDDILTITAGGISALGNRTAESSDDLIAMTGQKNRLYVIGTEEVSAVFKARGRFR